MRTRLNRRAVLRGGAALFLTGCAAKSATSLKEIPNRPVRLGWRWVPGEEYQYRTVVEQIRGHTLVSRAEQWSYLVRELDTSNVATLEAHLRGLGAGIRANENAVSQERLASAIETEKERSNQSIRIRIDMNGRLVALDDDEFARGIPHRMLCLNLPKTPILPNQIWANDEVLQPFVDLLPAELRTHFSADSRVLELRQTKDRITAVIETSGSARNQNGETLIAINGEAIWNAEHGHLLERTLKVTLPNDLGSHLANPGTLHIRTHLV